ncbi:hypothetical protein HC928_24750 [bacterium]|nr:hypothetical protein [bacterium]
MRGDLAHAAGMVVGAIMDEYDQASAITILAPLLAGAEARREGDEPDYVMAFTEAMLAVMDVPYASWRLALIHEAVPLWRELGQAQQYELWRKVAPRLSALPLAEALTCLGAMMPIVESIGGEAAVKDIAQVLGMR